MAKRCGRGGTPHSLLLSANSQPQGHVSRRSLPAGHASIHSRGALATDVQCTGHLTAGPSAHRAQ